MNETKSNFAERTIQNLQSRLSRMFMYKQSYSFLEELPNITQSVNDTPSRSLGNIAPSAVNKTNADEVRLSAYLVRTQTNITPKKKTLKPQTYKKKTIKRQPGQSYLFKINAKVRITREKSKFTSEYSQKWTGDWLVGCFGCNGPLKQYFSLYRAVSLREGERERKDSWLVGCFGFNGPLRQYFSLYRAVSQREGERGEKGQMREKMSKQPPPAPTASATGPCPTIIQISRTPPPDHPRERIDESKNVQTTPTRTYCKCSRPLPYCNPNGRTPRLWKFTQHHRTTRSSPWTGEVFIVFHKFMRDGIPIYKLKDFSNEPVSGSFYSQELQKVSTTEIWKVDKVLKKRKTPSGQKELFVSWYQWPSKFNSSIKESDLLEVS